MVEGTALEMRRGGNLTVSSNLTSSACDVFIESVYVKYP